MLDDAKAQELALYGQPLVGDETELEKARLARIQYLKNKMRPRLQALIGDLGDNITDTVRALILGEAIRLGLVIDQGQIDQYRSYVSAMLYGYGGADSILAVLLGSLSGLQAELIEGYYQAKSAIGAAESAEAVSAVDLPGEPPRADRNAYWVS